MSVRSAAPTGALEQIVWPRTARRRDDGGVEIAGIGPGPFAAILADSDAQVAVGGLDSDATDLADLRGTSSTPFVDVVRDGLSVTV